MADSPPSDAVTIHTMAESESGLFEKKILNAAGRPQERKPTWKDYLIGDKYLFHLNRQKKEEDVLRTQEQSLENLVIEMSDMLWSQAPPIPVTVKLHEPVIFKGQNIKRFLSAEPEMMAVRRVDEHTLEIIKTSAYPVILHVWDQRGRWTFSVEGYSRSVAQRRLLGDEDERGWVQVADPFEWTYTMNGVNTFAAGNTWLISHRLSTRGESPYGVVDSHLGWSQGQTESKINTFTLGLTDGHIGRLDKFNARLFDVQAKLSPLTLSGGGIRGLTFNKTSRNDRTRFGYFHGQEKANADPFATSGSRDVFFEGYKLDYFDQSAGRYSLNYGRSYGDDKQTDSADQAYSFDFDKKIDPWSLKGELGSSDGDALGKTLEIAYAETKTFFERLKLRDIDKDYRTVSGFPADRGEIGVSSLSNWNFDWSSLGLNVDYYKDRSDPLGTASNPSPDWSYTVRTSLNTPLGEGRNLSTSLGYEDISEDAAREAVHFNTNYNQYFNIWGKKASTNVHLGYQSTRYDFIPASDFDRYSMGAGFRIPVWDNWAFDTNYYYAIQDNVGTGLESRPSSLSLGLDYRRRYGDRLSTNFRTTYRKEMSEAGVNDNLSGQDRLSTAAGFTYKPAPEVEVYTDLEWSERLNTAASAATQDREIVIRWGMKADWISPFVWNPKGIIEGVVFKDFNGNLLQDADEPGVPDIKVRVGNKEMTTDEYGRYAIYVEAKRIKISLPPESLPEGYGFTTDFLREMDVVNRGIQSAYFGMRSFTGLTGLVFYDENDNDTYDAGEKLFGNIRLVLDNEQTIASDYDGSFNFSDISPGSHVLRIDVNSLPPEFAPKDKVQQTIHINEGSTTKFLIPLKM